MFQERKRPHRHGQPGDDDAPAGGLDEARSSMDALLRAGNDAIRHALSGNSEDFLRASRQHGGE